MRIFVASLSGLSSAPNQVKRFRYGADYSISSNTDIYSTNHEKVEFLSWKNSIRSTVFENGQTTVRNRDEYVQNIFEASTYQLTDRYNNGASIISIPDYYDAIWSASGVSAFPNAVLGASKPIRYPNIGTQMMYMSNGLVGVQLSVAYTDWDKGTGYGGTINLPIDPDVSETATIIATGTNGNGLPDYTATSSQGHKTYSYRNGQEGTWQVYASELIGGRNSSAGGNVPNTFYDEWDITKRAELSYYSTVRIADAVSMSGTESDKVAWIKNKIETQTIVNGGWFRNFTHWHTVSITLMELFYEALKSISDTESEICWFAGMSEAMEYRWFRDMTTNVAITTNGNTIEIDVTITNIYSLILADIITPISIEVDLTGTVLAGKDIVSNVGRVKSLGSNVYIVDVYADSLQTVLSEGTADYIDLNYPVVSGESFITGTLTIDTDVLTVATLFSDQIGTVVERKTSNAIQHIFTGLSSGTTYYLGIMSRENKSIVQTINT